LLSFGLNDIIYRYKYKKGGEFMPILDKIKEAEVLAEEIRVNAKKEVSLMLEEAAKENSEATKKMLEEAKDEVKKLNEVNSSYLKELSNQSNAEIEATNAANEKLAKVHLNETVEFILKKVIDS
jgi:vacuolar-type H+-ATPase subunit H